MWLCVTVSVLVIYQAGIITPMTSVHRPGTHEIITRLSAALRCKIMKTKSARYGVSERMQRETPRPRLRRVGKLSPKPACCGTHRSRARA